MKSIKGVSFLLITTLMLTFTGTSNAFAGSIASATQTEKKTDGGIFKNKKKKKKDCDCPGNKKNRKKVARERRKNHTS